MASVPSFPSPNVSEALDFWSQRLEEENPALSQLLAYTSAELRRTSNYNNVLRDGLVDVAWDIHRVQYGKSTPHGAMRQMFQTIAHLLFRDCEEEKALENLYALLEDWERGRVL